ncbi:MAG: GGDEF domain-containing protein [Gammaproteobacteria bacterium]|nr:GGDEF domain-containing protein [Gammaproteobacteria bacterium]
MNDRSKNDEDRKLMQQLPVGLVAMDAHGRIDWINDFMASLLPAEATGLVGRKPEDCDAEIRHLCSANPHLLQLPASGIWLNRELRTLDDGRSVLITLDVSEQERLAEENAQLRQQVEDLRLTDELTGLPNKRAIGQALDLHISRSRRYQNPLSAVLVYVEPAGTGDVQPLTGEPMILAVSRFLRDRLRWVDQVGRWDDNVFLAVLPETTETDARGLIGKISNEQHAMILPEGYAEARPRLSFGVACWQKGDDMRTLLRSALHDLQATGD